MIFFFFSSKILTTKKTTPRVTQNVNMWIYPQFTGQIHEWENVSNSHRERIFHSSPLEKKGHQISSPWLCLFWVISGSQGVKPPIWNIREHQFSSLCFPWKKALGPDIRILESVPVFPRVYCIENRKFSVWGLRYPIYLSGGMVCTQKYQGKLLYVYFCHPHLCTSNEFLGTF